MTEMDFLELEKILIHKNIVITTHKNPDGDAVGSSLALWLFLKKLNNSVNVIVPNDVPGFLKWMPGVADMVVFEQQPDRAKSMLEKGDIIFTLDFNHYSRTGEEMQRVLETTPGIKIMIDHHLQPDNYARYTYSDSGMSSTAQMVYHFIEKLGKLSLIDAEIATNIYTGIMTDTGSFRFRSTTSTTHRVLAALIDAGANNTKIHESVFDTNTPSRINLLATALKKLIILPELKTAYITLTQKDLDTNHFKKGDYEGFVNYALSVENITLAAFFVENKEEEVIKISFRSKGAFSVNEFARKHFNGGGHTNAAGGKSYESLSKTVRRFITTLESYKNILSA